MENQMVTFQRFVTKEEEGTYLTLPFSLPEQVEAVKLSYEYDRTNNIIDLGLSDHLGEFIGWSGSDRRSVIVSERKSSAGFATVPIKAGPWNVLLGAYKVQEEGVMVTFTAELFMKHLRILKGDPHVHSCGSDGNMTTEELALVAEKEGLDYLFITDHNNYAHNHCLASTDQVTLAPGVEWTNYKGHAGMLGLKRPFSSFVANSREDMLEIFQNARKAGALLVLNHPFCPNCGWKWGLEKVSYDLIEIWNGALSMERNLSCVDWWDKQLKAGRRIAITGGSDFHRFQEGRMVAMPCTCVYAMSNTTGDILRALKKGRSFVTSSPEGPLMELGEEGIFPGDEATAGRFLSLKLSGLLEGDEICLIWGEGREKAEVKGESKGIMEIVRKLPEKGYYRVEIRRQLWPKGEKALVFLSNPFYITGEGND